MEQLVLGEMRRAEAAAQEVQGVMDRCLASIEAAASSPGSPQVTNLPEQCLARPHLYMSIDMHGFFRGTGCPSVCSHFRLWGSKHDICSAGGCFNPPATCCNSGAAPCGQPEAAAVG